MTRRRKFEVGDLIVLKKDALVESHPANPQDALGKEVLRRTHIRNVVRNLGSFGRRRRNADVLAAGTVGVVKGFENVYMLEYKMRSAANLPVMSDYFISNNYAIVNMKMRKHLHVLINGRLIAFAPGGKLFEKADVELSKYKNVFVKFEGVIELENIANTDLKLKVQHALSRLSTLSKSVKVTSLECVHRDGTLETKENLD